MKKGRTILRGQAVFAAALFASWTLNAGQAAETPQIVDAKMETRPITASLAETLRGIEAQANAPEWVGYSVSEIAGDRTVWCGNFNDG